MSNLSLGQKDGDKGRSEGGKAVKDHPVPAFCSCCNRSMTGKTWHQYLGHRGLIKASRKLGVAPDEFLRRGLALQDPFPENGAWQQWGES